MMRVLTPLSSAQKSVHIKGLCASGGCTTLGELYPYEHSASYHRARIPPSPPKITVVINPVLLLGFQPPARRVCALYWDCQVADNVMTPMFSTYSGNRRKPTKGALDRAGYKIKHGDPTSTMPDTTMSVSPNHPITGASTGGKGPEPGGTNGDSDGVKTAVMRWSMASHSITVPRRRITPSPPISPW